jgi:glucose-6-phosphate isomerase
MKGKFFDYRAFQEMLAKGDPLLYEVYEIYRPEMPGELQHGVSVIHPGKVGDEYFMTKGHYHAVLDTSEVYYCICGDGVMVMETPEGEWSVEEMHPGDVVYVPPRWAHRSVNVNLEHDFVMLFVYPGNAGHDYGSIEQQGFRKLIFDRDGRYEIIDNPNWLPSEKR